MFFPSFILVQIIAFFQSVWYLYDANDNTGYLIACACSFEPFSNTLFFVSADSLCCWTLLCHRPWEDLPLLFPEAQDEGHQFLPGRSVCGVDWLAHYWSFARDLWFFSLIQVRWIQKAHNRFSRLTVILFKEPTKHWNLRYSKLILYMKEAGWLERSDWNLGSVLKSPKFYILNCTLESTVFIKVAVCLKT